MRDIRGQYFITYGVMGSLFPYGSVFLKERGLTSGQIGWAYAISSLAVIVSPWVASAAADRHIDPRKLMAAAYMVAAAAALGMAGTHGFAPLLICWAAYWLAAWPLMPLQDGIFFSLQRSAEAAGAPTTPYHRVRVWGTIGFIAPTLVLYGILGRWTTLTAVIVFAGICSLVGAIHALQLPDPRPAGGPPARNAADAPLADAFRAMRSPSMARFVLGMALLWAGIAAYGPFYPIYLTDEVGFEARWVGMIINVGVVVEVFFILGAGRLTNRFGERALVTAGVALVVVRMVLLASSASPAVAIGTQLVHGIQSVVMLVIAPVYLNRHAGDRYRHSMQGLFVMIMGVARAAGSLAAGYLAETRVQNVFAMSAGLCLASGGLLVWAFASAAADARPDPSPVVEPPLAGDETP